MFDSFRGASWPRVCPATCTFAALLDEQQVSSKPLVRQGRFGKVGFTPARHDTWVFLSTMQEPGPFLSRCGVNRLSAWQLAQGRRPCSAPDTHPATGGYASARLLCPNRRAANWFCYAGRESEAQSPAEWLWHGRRVRVVDGSTILAMPDAGESTDISQARRRSPAAASHRADPAVIFCWRARCWRRWPVGRYQGRRAGENSLFRTLHDVLEAGMTSRRWPTAISAAGFDIALLGQARRGCRSLRKHQKRASYRLPHGANVWDPTITSCVRRRNRDVRSSDADRTVRSVAQSVAAA